MHVLPDGTRIIAPYDERWPQLYEQEAQRVRSVIGRHILDIQHIAAGHRICTLRHSILLSVWSLLIHVR